MKNNLCRILEYGLKLGASDIHIKSDEDIFIRFDGDLQRTEKFVSEAETIDLVKSLEGNIEKEVDFKSGARTVEGTRIRYNIFKSMGKYSISIRLVRDYIIPLEELVIYKDIKDLLREAKGLILITGSTGSGKTMTLNSILDFINRKYNYSIYTLEDPVEYIHKPKASLINQLEIGKDIDNYEKGLKSALRNDIEVLSISELREQEAISIALTAAETGHLVISTLHTLNTSKTIDRIIDVFSESRQNQIRLQLSTSIRAIFSQKLVRKKEKRQAEFQKMIVTSSIRNLIRENKVHQINNIIRSSGGDVNSF